MMPTKPIAGYSKTESWKIFDSIYRRYDFSNRILSLGLDVQWRKKLAEFVPDRPDVKLLDLATGTADVLITLLNSSKNIIAGFGIDLSENMLTLGREKIAAANLADRILLHKGDATALTFLNDEFDIETMAFGIRNVENPILVIKEMYRTLKPSGKAVILEFSLPNNLFIRWAHLLYLKVIVPIIGGLLSGNFRAYYYLNRTIEKFPYGEMFCRMMRQCGFKNVEARPLFFGVATLYVGEKV